MISVYEQRQEICEIGKRMYDRGYVASNDGNISMLVRDDEILTTPSGVSKGFMKPDMIIAVDQNGHPKYRTSDYKPSSEIKMHTAVYARRPDIKAVVHAHPVFATAFSIAGIPLDSCVLPEVIVSFGGAPIVPYATPSTDEVPNNLIPFLEQSDVFLLENHGALALGSSLIEAYHRLESLEHFAQILHRALALGPVHTLECGEVDKLRQVREKMGIGGKYFTCKSR